MLAHLPLQLGIVAMAVGMSKFLQVQDHVYYESIIILSVAFAMIYGGLAAIGLLGDRHPYRPLLLLRLATACAWRWPPARLFWNRGWEPSPFLAILAVLAVAHAVIAYRLRLRTTWRRASRSPSPRSRFPRVVGQGAARVWRLG